MNRLLEQGGQESYPHVDFPPRTPPLLLLLCRLFLGRVSPKKSPGAGAVQMQEPGAVQMHGEDKDYD